MKAIRLRTEYLSEPLGLGNLTPRFYWNCDGGMIQTAYRIVARRGDEVVWDSGKVSSSSMTHITYAGMSLQSRDIVNWTVNLWDENDVMGESSEGKFEIGLTEISDWKAKWISGDYKPQKNERYPVDCFCKSFSLSKDIASARLYATACGIYDVTINDSTIKDFIFAPGMTDYRKRIQYQTYDVTALLKGENVLELRLADGWYRGSCAAYGVTGVYGFRTSALAQLEINYIDGSTDMIVTDESWRWSNDGPIRFADLKDGEVYNAQMSPSYSRTATVVDAPKAMLVASDNVPVKEKEHFFPLELPHGVLDFGQNIAGYLEFTVCGKPGDTFRLVCGEILDEDGNVTLSNIQETVSAKRYDNTAMMIKLLMNKAIGVLTLTPLQEIRFTCSGGTDHYKASFSVFGFRYVQIDGNADLKDIRAIAVYSNMEEVGDFSCSNESVNRLYQNTLWSMKGNYLDLPTDCPTRERLGWTGDAQIFFNTGAYFMDTSAFFRKWIRDMKDAQYKNGLLPTTIPYQGIEMMYKATGQSVGWADAVYLIPYRYYLAFGDRQLLNECYPMMKSYADYLMKNLGLKDKKAARKNPYNDYTYEKGMHLGEWLEPEEFKEKITAGKKPCHSEEATAYLYLTMSTMAEIAKILEKQEDKKIFDRYADGARKAYSHLFVKSDMLDTDRQAKLVRPLALGLLEGDEKRYAQTRLIKAVKDYRYRVGTGFLSTPFLLGVLTEAGESEIAYKMLENTERPSWLYEISQGATTVWETWEGDASRNHYSPGAVCQWLFDTVVGIRPDGENRFTVQPVVGGSLTYARGTYKSIYGLIESTWEKKGEKTVYTVNVPANTTVRLLLPDGSNRMLDPGRHIYTVQD